MQQWKGINGISVIHFCIPCEVIPTYLIKNCSRQTSQNNSSAVVCSSCCLSAVDSQSPLWCPPKNRVLFAEGVEQQKQQWWEVEPQVSISEMLKPGIRPLVYPLTVSWTPRRSSWNNILSSENGGASEITGILSFVSVCQISEVGL